MSWFALTALEAYETCLCSCHQHLRRRCILSSKWCAVVWTCNITALPVHTCLLYVVCKKDRDALVRLPTYVLLELRIPPTYNQNCSLMMHLNKVLRGR
jgi:hypothetical protein